MNARSARLITSSGSPDQITRSASLPTDSDPIRASTPMIRAGLIVTARSAVTGSRPSLTARVAWWMRKWIGTTGWSVVMAMVTPAAASRPGLASDRLRSSTLDRLVNSGPMIPGICAAAVCLELEVAINDGRVRRRVLRSRRGGQLRLVVLRGHERAADYRRGAEPGRRGLVPLAVDPLGVLAQRGLQARRLAQHHLVHGAAPALDGRGLATDRVGRAGVDVDRQHAAADGIAEPLVGRVDRVQRAHMRGVRAGPLVGVLARPALRLLVHAGVGVRVDEAGQPPLPGGGGHGPAGRHREPGPLDGRDLPVPEQDGPALDRLTLDRDDPAPPDP